MVCVVPAVLGKKREKRKTKSGRADDALLLQLTSPWRVKSEGKGYSACPARSFLLYDVGKITPSRIYSLLGFCYRTVLYLPPYRRTAHGTLTFSFVLPTQTGWNRSRPVPVELRTGNRKILWANLGAFCLSLFIIISKIQPNL